MLWLVMAVLSAVFAALTAVLAKCGIRRTDSDLATALRTIVVLAFSWLMAALTGSVGQIAVVSVRSFVFLALSGLATGASWICCFKALSLGDVNKVAPVDKSSTLLTVLAGILLFGETGFLAARLIGLALLGVGIFLMIEKKDVADRSEKGWFVWAALSAVFAAATSLLAKIGIENVESNLATALRTCVVLVMAWVVVFMKGKGKLVKQVEKKELLFITLSGFATGGSWLCYYYAIAHGPVSVVVPIDKMSILFTVLIAGVVFHEKLSRRAGAGLALMLVGTLCLAAESIAKAFI